MGLTRENLRLHAYIFFLAVPLNLVWEVAQIGAYDFPRYDLLTNMLGCFIPSLGDGLMTLIIFWIEWLTFRTPHWILSPGARGYLLMLGAGFILAVGVEWNALYRTGGWAYDEKMVVLPIVGAGLLPILQMIILPPAVALLVQQIWRKT